MVNEKARIIKKLGAIAKVTYPDGTEYNTKFLVSKAVKQGENMISLEYHRKGDFLFEDNITAGCLIENVLTSETYISIATYSSVFKDKVLSTVSHMLITNGTLSVTRDIRVADDNGNVRTQPSQVISDVPVYCELVNQQLRQYNPGLFSDAEYLMYSPQFDVSELDKVVFRSGTNFIPFKVVFFDNITYPGVTELQLKTETRK